MTVIIVSYNAHDELMRCLASLKASKRADMRIVVIDNNSDEPNVPSVRSKFPEVTLIVNDTNRGFAAAVNQGIAASHGDVLLLNPDCAVEPDTIPTLMSVLDSDPSAGIVGPRLCYPDGTLQPSVKRFPDWIDLFLVLSKIPNFIPSISKVYNGLTVDYSRQQYVDQVMGACFLIRRSVIDSIGTLDEGFWMWFEEVDFCKRAAAKGWKTVYTPSAKAIHARAASTTGTNSEKQRILRNSIVHYSRKYFGPVMTAMLMPAELISVFSSYLVDTFGLTKPQRAKEH